MKEVIHTDNAPKAIGPYSQAIKVGKMVYTSGQVAIDPDTGELNNETIEDEVKQIMSNLDAVLQKSGSSLDNVVKTTIFLVDLEQYGKVNELYGSYFEDKPPARSTVQVAKLPLDVNIEIEMIAAVQ